MSQSKSSKTSLKSKIQKWILNIIKAGITFGILFYLYKNGMLDFSRVKKVLSNPATFLISLGLLFSATVAGVIRWQGLLHGQKLDIQMKKTFELSMIGVFFNTALPGAVSGDLVKGYYVVKQQPNGKGKIKAFTTLLLDRLLGLSALICVSFAAMLFNFKEIRSTPALQPLCGMITILWVAVVLFYSFVLIEWSFSSKILKFLNKLPAGEYFSKLYEAVKAYESCRHYMYKGMIVSLSIHCVLISVCYMLSQSLGGFEHIPASKFFFLIPFGLLVTAVPIAPAGLGTGHYAFYKLFHMVGASGGADLFTAYVTFQILISLVGGIFYIKYRDHRL